MKLFSVRVTTIVIVLGADEAEARELAEEAVDDALEIAAEATDVETPSVATLVTKGNAAHVVPIDLLDAYAGAVSDRRCLRSAHDDGEHEVST